MALHRLEPQARLHIQVKGAVGVDMEVDKGGEGLEISWRHPCPPCRIGEDMLQHESVDVDERNLEEMEGEHSDFLVFQAVGSQLTAFAIEDEVVGTVPVFDYLKSIINFSSEGFLLEILAEKDRLDHLPEFDDRVVRGVWEGAAGKAFEKGLGIGSAQPEGRRILDHSLIMLPEQVPANRPSQDGLEMRIRLRLAGRRPIELLAMDPFEAGQQLEIEEVAKGKRDLTLAMTVHIVFLQGHLGSMAEEPFEHGGHFRRRDGFQLRINTDGSFLHMPIYLS